MHFDQIIEKSFFGGKRLRLSLTDVGLNVEMEIFLDGFR